MKRIILILSILLILSACTEKHKFKEVGPIPTYVIWHKQHYIMTEKVVNSIGEKLGITEKTSLSKINKSVYQIKGHDPKKEIAIEQKKNLYYKYKVRQ